MIVVIHARLEPHTTTRFFSRPISVLYYRDTQINHEKRDELSDLKNYKNACISLKLYPCNKNHIIPFVRSLRRGMHVSYAHIGSIGYMESHDMSYNMGYYR